MIVHVPTPLRSYTKGASKVAVDGETLGAVLDDLDAHYPGFRFRIIDEHDHVRPHIMLFLDTESVEDLGRPLTGVGAVHIICALSGG